ncbi:glycosyltransferase family 2 protein [Pleionea sediminis]|uniref:glycosyltransferase family 2 protein n=1 Tax=Pleionea sediminis TaxID=2569479 RepID=UPI00118606D4|nr:glycosyltransferase family 2 protein [Pleionea sediminis]
MLEESLLLLSLFGVIYSYFIYPIVLILFKKFGKNNSTSNSETNHPFPKISFIITAYNEEQNIRQKLENTLSCDYGGELEILVASDGSSDKTNQYVSEFASQGVQLVNVKERLGKENAQKAAIAHASGNIIVFSDVSTRIEPHAIEQIATAFKDPSVGAVSSEDRFMSQSGEIVGEGAYVKYEMWLRGLESQVHSLVGLSGSFFAARKEICEHWDITVPSDFNTALNSVEKGFRAITDPELLGFYPDIKNSSNEYQRKVRTVIRGIAALAEKRQVLNPFKFGFFSFQVFSHKVMRWMVPWFMISSLLLNTLLIGQHFIWSLLLYGQILFYTLVLLGWLIPSLQKLSIIKLSFFFVQVNLAILHATFMFLSGKRITKWEPSKR